MSAEEYRFVSINNLIEQEIGRIILTEIYKQINIEISTSPRPGKRAEREAITGVSDGEIMRIWSYGDNNPSMIRVPTPYYSLKTMVFTRKDSDIHIRDAKELNQYKVAKVRGVKHTDSITQGIKHTYIFDNTERMMNYLSRGRAHIALTSALDGKVTLERLQIENIIPSKTSLAELNLYHYLHKKNAHLVPIIDDKIQVLKQSGELEKIIKSAEKQVFNRP